MCKDKVDCTDSFAKGMKVSVLIRLCDIQDMYVFYVCYIQDKQSLFELQALLLCCVSHFQHMSFVLKIEKNKHSSWPRVLKEQTKEFSEPLTQPLNKS